jgi:hypothetical protein
MARTLLNSNAHCKTMFFLSYEKDAHLTERHCPVHPMKFNYLTPWRRDPEKLVVINWLRNSPVFIEFTSSLLC